MEDILYAMAIFLEPATLGMLAVGVVSGVVIGAAPGLTSTIAIGLLVPFTFGLTKYTAFPLLLGIYVGSMYGGSIPAILMNLPGTPTAAITALDGYPLSRKGRSGYALTVSVLSSTLGGLASCVVLIFLSFQLAFLATTFAGPEYFALCIFALAVVFSTTAKSLVKGIVSTGLGLLVATVGLDPVSSYPRFTFGVSELMIGVPEVAATIGLFCVAEGFRLLLEPGRTEGIHERVRITTKDVLPIIRKFWKTILKSSGIGTITGILPGAGAMMASFIAYGEARRVSKEPGSFGQGSPEGVSASESANNSVTGGALVPMLTLGIPGDVNTLMLLGAMLVHGLIPGPSLFNEESSLVYVIFMSMIFANIILLIIGMYFAPMLGKVTQLDQRYIVPVILVLAITGPAIAAGHIYYFWITLAFGVVGYVMEKGGFSVMAMAMAIILGPIIERNLRAALMRPEGFTEIFVGRPITFSLLLVALAIVGVTLYREIVARSQRGS